MQLFILSGGRSKKRLHPLMIDSKVKCEKYRDAILSSKQKTIWFDIQPAPLSSVAWRKNTSGQWTNYGSSHPPLTKNDSRQG